MSFESEHARELVARGVAAARSDRHEEARRLLEQALSSEPDLRDMIRAWQCLAEIAGTPEEKRTFLGKMLAADPLDGYARRELAVLNGVMRREDIVDPDTVSPGLESAAASGVPRQARRLTCPKCGSGRMAADPAHRELVCRYCGHREAISTTVDSSLRDVAAALWTARGRSVPRSTNVFECKGCGASFLMAPKRLSATCPYCDTSHVFPAGPRALIEPDGIILFKVSAGEARMALEKSGARASLSQIRGVYTPVWLIGFSGEVDWHGMQRDPYGMDSDRREEVSGTHTIIETVARVNASPRSPEMLSPEALQNFDVGAIVPYEPTVLADWPAETYQMSLELAVVAGRKAVLPVIRREVRDQIDSGVEDVEMRFSRVAASSYRLILFPVWLARLDDSGAMALVNGQTGPVTIDEE